MSVVSLVCSFRALVRAVSVSWRSWMGETLLGGGCSMDWIWEVSAWAFAVGLAWRCVKVVWRSACSWG
eukprot:12588694-Alexandrium_andersonii.AAC.1